VNEKPYKVYSVKRAPRRRWKRIVLWSLAGLVVLLIALGGGFYLWLNGVITGSTTHDSTIISAINNGPPTTIIPAPTSGMDILVLGSDIRTTQEETGRSDTIMLVHADIKQNFLSMLSIPRDLYVDVPGHGKQKINSAYAFGGGALTIQTVKELTGVNIKQYMEVDFNAFKDLTDAVGGVYVDVDARYYNADPKWELVNLSPGYQLLDGADALDYVRFRHDLNLDFGRMDRQQRFLNALREQAIGWNLPLKLPGYISALFKNVNTTLGTNDVIRLAAWGIKLGGDRIRQVSIVGDPQMVDGQSVVVASSATIRQAVEDFLTPPAAATTAATTQTGTAATTTATTGSSTSSTAPVITDPALIANSNLWSLMASAAPFAVEAPGYLPEGYKYVSWDPAKGQSGSYGIKVGSGTQPAIKVVYQLTREGAATDQYLGIMETSWTSAPAASKGQEVQHNGLTFTIVGTSQKVDHIWWKKDGVLYWVSNTLSYYASKKELLKVAESMIAIPKTGTASSG